MVYRWLSWLNFSLFGLALVLSLAGGMYWLKQPEEIVCGNLRAKECGLPKGAFELTEGVYQQTGEPLLALQEAPPTMQLPDLRQQGLAPYRWSG